MPLPTVVAGVVGRDLAAQWLCPRCLCAYRLARATCADCLGVALWRRERAAELEVAAMLLPARLE